MNLDDLEASAVSGFGHTLSRHVGKSMEWLQQRVWANRIPVASSFYSKELAEKVIGALTSARAREIDAWLAGSSPRLDLTADLADLGFVDPEALGIVMRGVFIGPGVVVVPRTVAVYLYRDTRGRVGIATATLGA